MHHKRKRPKNLRAGCLWCKPHKANHAARRGETDKLAVRRKEDEREIIQTLA